MVLHESRSWKFTFSLVVVAYILVGGKVGGIPVWIEGTPSEVQGNPAGVECSREEVVQLSS